MDYRRNFQPGGTFFFTVVTCHRQKIFANTNAVSLLQTVLREVKAERPFRMEAWAILPDHLHMIWTLPPSDADFSGRWSKIKSQFTRRWLAVGGREESLTPGKKRDERRGVWQPKFFEHTIRDEDDMIAHVEYVHFNPVKHHYADCPRDWAHSSFHEYVRRNIYESNWCCGTSSAPVADLTYEGAE